MPLSRGGPYRLNDVRRVWRRNRSVTSESAKVYLQWLDRFARYCERCALDQRAELTEQGAERFARWWRTRGSPRRGRLQVSIIASHRALRAWAFALSMLGESMPPWRTAASAAALDRRWQPFADYLRTVRGNPAGTIGKKIKQLIAFERYRRSRGRSGSPIRLAEIDAYIIACARRLARRTVSDICSTLRGYLRFLHVTGATSTDLAASVMAPIVRPAERPYRALPWSDVQKILRAVDRTRPKGRRDYALLLTMSLYGLGAGEVIRLRLEDVDWRACTIHVTRPKTGVEFLLPLLPAVARALTDYLTRARPTHTPARELFVRMRTPFGRLTASSAVRHILHEAAHRAEVTAPFLGTHALRHTHACRQLELGTPPKIIGDILGHRDPESTSAYLRVASDRLRELSLPVPV
jgi:integrase/recombinase XerD